MSTAPARVLSDELFPAASLTRDVLLVAGAALALAVAAQVRIPLPHSPVPVTGQTFVALVAGAALGSRKGPAAVLLYLALGAAGLPVFAGGTAGAFFALATGGYLLGLAFAAAITGLLAERGWDRGPRVILALALGNLAVYAVGLPWLAAYLATAGSEDLLARTLVLGLLPFLPGDALKLLLASACLPACWAALRREG